MRNLGHDDEARAQAEEPMGNMASHKVNGAGTDVRPSSVGAITMHLDGWDESLGEC